MPTSYLSLIVSILTVLYSQSFATSSQIKELLKNQNAKIERSRIFFLFFLKKIEHNSSKKTQIIGRIKKAKILESTKNINNSSKVMEIFIMYNNRSVKKITKLQANSKCSIVMFEIVRNCFNKQFFGVSSWWAEKLGVEASFVRLFFIYATFSNAIAILVYLLMIFLLKITHHLKYRKRKSVFDL